MALPFAFTHETLLETVNLGCLVWIPSCGSEIL